MIPDIDEDHEDYDLLLAICERLMPQADSDDEDAEADKQHGICRMTELAVVLG